MKHWIRNLPLRYKLLFATLVIEALMLALLVGNSVRLNGAELQEQGELRAQETAQTLSAALGPALAQRDYAAVHDMLDSLFGRGQIVMLAVHDPMGRLIHQVGRAVRSDDFAVRNDIRLGGQSYGELEFVLSGKFVRHARAAHLTQSLLIAAIALALTGLLLYGAVGWLVQRFEALSRAAHSMAQGNLYVTLPDEGRDEVGQLVATFNQMVQSVRFSIDRARDNEARFHAIADYTYDIELWLSPAGKLLWVNPSVERILGHTVGECMGAMDFPLDVVYPADRQASEFQLRQALRGTSGQGFSLRLQRRDGSHFWAVMNWQPIHDVSGAYQGIRASIHDVDDQKAVEGNLRQALVELRVAENLQVQYLKESEQERARLVSLLAAMNLGILFVAADGRVIYHNATFNRMWLIDETVQLIGLPVQEALSRSVAALARPDHFSRHLLSVLEAREALRQLSKSR
jgi:PAS domain S-box